MDHRRPKLLPVSDSLSPMPLPCSPRFGQDDPDGRSGSRGASEGAGVLSDDTAAPGKTLIHRPVSLVVSELVPHCAERFYGRTLISGTALSGGKPLSGSFLVRSDPYCHRQNVQFSARMSF
jgi:hypothetical protein